MFFHTGNILPLYHNTTAVNRDTAANHIEHGSFPRTVTADYGNKFAFFYF